MLHEKSVHSTFCARTPIGNRFGGKVHVFADRLHDATVLLAGIIIIARICPEVILFVDITAFDMYICTRILLL